MKPDAQVVVERDGFWHNAVAHPLLILCPPVGRWLHERTEPTVPRATNRRHARIVALVLLFTATAVCALIGTVEAGHPSPQATCRSIEANSFPRVNLDCGSWSDGDPGGGWRAAAMILGVMAGVGTVIHVEHRDRREGL